MKSKFCSYFMGHWQFTLNNKRKQFIHWEIYGWTTLTNMQTCNRGMYSLSRWVHAAHINLRRDRVSAQAIRIFSFHFFSVFFVKKRKQFHICIIRLRNTRVHAKHWMQKIFESNRLFDTIIYKIQFICQFNGKTFKLLRVCAVPNRIPFDFILFSSIAMWMCLFQLLLPYFCSGYICWFVQLFDVHLNRK